MIIHETKKYKMFELHDLNREVKTWLPKFKKTLKHMQKCGFESSKQICVVPNGNGKFKIVDGHHRFVAAKMLGLPIMYSLKGTKISLQSMVETETPWSLSDWLFSYVQQANPNYIATKEYHECTGISLMNCISILGGESAGSNNKFNQFKEGKFILGNQYNAISIKELVLCLKENQFKYATHANLVLALSLIVWVNEFDPTLMVKKLSTHSHLVKRHPSRDDYLDMLEKIYNYRQKDQIPLAFLAKKASAERKKAVLGPKKKKQ